MTAVLSATATSDGTDGSGRAKTQKDWLSRKEAARYLSALGHKIEAQTLANLASNGNAGKGPPFSRNGWKQVQYARADLDAWARARRVCVR